MPETDNLNISTKLFGKSNPIQNFNNFLFPYWFQIIGLLVEGNSLHPTSRLVDCSINTVTKLLGDIGYACAIYQNEAIRNINNKRGQCDEIGLFCYSKEKNVAAED